MKMTKMKFSKNKIAAMTISVLFVLSMTASIMIMPTASAHNPPISIPTYSFLNVAPNPIGLGQSVQVNMWLDKVPPTAQGEYGDRWHNITVTVTHPDGSTEKLGPFTTDATGSTWTKYTPATTGNYTFQMSFGGQTLAGANPPLYSLGAAYVGDYFQPSVSQQACLLVEQKPVSSLPLTPLPSGYWQNPIEATNIAWSTLGGNWLQTGYNSSATDSYFNPYTTSPSTAHVLWTKTFLMGGQVGGGLLGGGNDQTVYEIDQYQMPFSPAIVINGMLFYNKYPSGYGLPGIIALNLRTGQQVWYTNGTGKPVTNSLGLNQPGVVFDNNTFNRLTLGEVYNYVSGNQYGSQAYLWAIAGTRYDMYDASTGTYMLSLNHCMSGTFVYSPTDGSLLCYILSANGWLAMWNSSLVTGMLGGTFGNPGWQWRPQVGQMLDWRTGVQWNTTIKVYTAPYTESIARVSSGVVLANTNSPFRTMPVNWVLEIGYSATTGQELWHANRTLTLGGMPGSEWDNYCPVGYGVITHFNKENLTWSAYNIYTGKEIWGPTAPYVNDPLAFFGIRACIAYNTLYCADYGGSIHAYDLTNGKLLWAFSTPSGGFDWASGNFPFTTNQVGFAIADGMVYAATGHWYNPPMFNGAQMYCLNATNGQVISTIPGWWENTVVADGEMLSFNGYDNQIYAFGTGLSATTVNASPGINSNSKVLITGTVTDQSPGQTCLGIPAAGTPAVSDASQNGWMAYLYEQKPEPTNATGVSVTLSYVDPNNNSFAMGTTTSDITGHYSYAFAPTVPGKYTITATFEGSKAYYSSSAETTMLWNPAEAAAVVTATPTSIADAYFMPAIIGLFVLIIAVAIVLSLLMLRKRP